mgnify:CR=1 FL=1
MPEPAAWRYQKITKPMFDLPQPHVLFTGRVLTMTVAGTARSMGLDVVG